MDCSSILELLDCVRSGSDDLSLPAFDAARAHLETCSACQQEFVARQRFDAQVVASLHRVPVPGHLHAQLLVAVAEQPMVAPQSKAGTASRRTWLKLAGLVAAVAAILIVAFLPPAESQYAVDELISKLSVDDAQVSSFDAAFVAPVPTEWGGRNALQFRREVVGQDLDGRPGHDVALRNFSFVARRGAPIQGYLAIVPARRIMKLPAAVNFTLASPSYPMIGNRQFVAVAWQEGDSVYVCLIPANPAHLEMLQRYLQGEPA